MAIVSWLRHRDRDLSALRRAGRAAIVLPVVFALTDRVIGDVDMATFAAFGSLATLLFVDFTGPVRARLQAQAGLVLTGAVFVCLGTLASQWIWLATVAMVIVGFAVLFLGVVSSQLAGATTALLLAFILPLSLPAPVSVIPDRLVGWGLAGILSLFAIALLWPAPERDPLRKPSALACRSLAARLRSDVSVALGESTGEADRTTAIAAAGTAVADLRQVFLATPYRPTGLSTGSRMLVRLVDELAWLGGLVEAAPDRTRSPVDRSPVDNRSFPVTTAAADLLSVCAGALDGADPAEPGRASPDRIAAARARLDVAVSGLQQRASLELPVHRTAPVDAARTPITEFVSALDPGFRALEIAFAVTQVADNAGRLALADRRGWWQRLVGQPVAGLMSLSERASAHLQPHSVWLHNSLRGAVGLGLAILIAELLGAPHSFWVVLGTLSVLRSSVLSTGQNALRAVLGTAVGFGVGALLLWAVGTDHNLLWILLPVVVLIAGFAPAAISFTAGQAAFTVTVVILFNIVVPEGWRLGLIRIEDVALGCGVSLLVGLLLWPRGAAAALGRALAEAYVDSARYLDRAVGYGLGRCDPDAAPPAPPLQPARRAAAAARRLDDAFRGFLAERGTKHLPLAQVSRLLTGVVRLRSSADAVLDLWLAADGPAVGDPAGARGELQAGADRITGWYTHLAAALAEGDRVPDPLEHDNDIGTRFVAAMRRDLGEADRAGTATAARLIWTGDHIDNARRLQHELVEPARVAARARPRTLIHPGHGRRGSWSR